MGDLIDMATSAAALLEKKRRERWHLDYGPEIAKPRPPIAYVCRDLAIAPGCSIWGGSGFSGKTTTLQSLMLSIVTGTPAWGQFDVQRGDIAHIDFEQGPDLTYLKYQRMGHQMGVDVGSLGRRLACSSLPEETLDVSTASRDELCWLFENRTAGIIDAFKGAFPEAKENDSGARAYLDMVHKVGLKVGCAIIVVAHSRKLGEDSDVRTSLRGSSALFDAPQTVWMLSGAKGRPTRCENVKERLRGKLRESFGLAIEDTAGPGPEAGTIDDEWGLDVRYLSPPELQAAYDVPDGADNSLAINAARIESVGRRVGDLLASSPDGLTMTTIRGLLHGAVTPLDLNAVMPILISTGAVWQDGRGTTAVYREGNGREPGID